MRLYQKLIYDQTGMYFSPAKKEILEARLARRLSIHGQPSYGAYYRFLKDHPEEWDYALDCICTYETRFFREPRHFELLEKQILPEWLDASIMLGRTRAVRAWSAGCSTGEEPYSLAMMLCDCLPGWSLEVVATDISSKVLERAKNAMWPIQKATEIPLEYQKKFMLKGTKSQEGRMRAGREVRSVVRFERANLSLDELPLSGYFDLIFCRNVLIYFDVASRSRAIHRMLRYLNPGGYLFIGHAESLSGVTDKMQIVIPTVYKLAEPSQASRESRDAAPMNAPSSDEVD